MSSKIKIDRFYKNTLDDYSGQNYLDEFDKLNHEYVEQIHKYLKVMIKSIQENLQDQIDPQDKSVYSGMAGIAYMFLKYYLETNQEDYLNIAESLINLCLRGQDRDRITFLCGTTGSLAIAAYLAHLKGETEKAHNFVSKILINSPDIISCTSDELLYGRAGYLYTLIFIRKNIARQLIPDSLIEDVFNLIVKSGKRYSAANDYSKVTPLMYAWHDSEYIGAAHGLAGILYTLLLAIGEVPELEKHLQSTIIPSLDFLRTCKYEGGNYVSSIGSETDKLVQYCHGSPGVGMTFSLAYKMTHKDEYLQEAFSCGEITWERGLLKKGYGLCHGVVGNAYALLDLYNLTNDQKWLHRTWMFAKWCIESQHRESFQPDRPLSLYEGISGTIVFLVDLIRPRKAQFPGHQL